MGCVDRSNEYSLHALGLGFHNIMATLVRWPLLVLYQDSLCMLLCLDCYMVVTPLIAPLQISLVGGVLTEELVCLLGYLIHVT